MKRVITRLLLWLAAGVVLNVLVAWACATWSAHRAVATPIVTPAPGSFFQYRLSDDVTDSVMTIESRGVGLTVHHAIRIPWWADSASNFESTFVHAGWPFRCLAGEVWGTGEREHDGLWRWPIEFNDLAGDRRTAIDAAPLPATVGPLRIEPDRVLPLRPLFGGLLLNAALYAGAAWCLLCGPFEARRAWRDARGRCVKCGYDRRQTPGACPECGRE